MKITARIKEAPPQEYPYMGISRDQLNFIVWFTSENEGIAITKHNSRHSTTLTKWPEKNFVPFYGAIYIQDGE